MKVINWSNKNFTYLIFEKNFVNKISEFIITIKINSSWVNKSANANKAK